MPEDQEKNNNEDSQSKADENQSGDFRNVTPESKRQFEEVLEEVRRGMETQVNEENAEVLDPNSPLIRVGEIAAKNAAKRAVSEEYQRKANFERTNSGFQKPQNFPRASEAGMEEGSMEAVRAAKRAEIEKVAEEEMKENFTADQQRAVMIAGDKAISILAKVAEEMAEVAEGGGLMGEVIILFTFVLAIGKDLADAFLVSLAVATLPIPVLDIALPVSIKLLSWIIGFATSTILIFFWMTISGSWKGGLATNWIMKVLLRFVIGGVIEGAISVLPVYTILNAWCYYDYRKEQKKGAEEGERAEERIDLVRKDVNESINRIGAASL